MDTTSGREDQEDIGYVTVAANISALLAKLQVARTAAKVAVEVIVMHILLTAQRTKMVTTGKIDDIIVVDIVLAVLTFESL